MIMEMTTSALIYYGVASTRGTSDAARHIADQLQTGRRHLQNSVSFGFAEKSALNELFAVADECKASNWDAQGAAPVTDDTYRIAYRLLEAMPLGTATPSIGAEPDGHITLEWYRSPRRTLSVSVSPDSDLHYAALLGPRKRYGTEPFFGDVPKVILDLVAEVTIG